MCDRQGRQIDKNSGGQGSLSSVNIISFSNLHRVTWPNLASFLSFTISYLVHHLLRSVAFVAWDESRVSSKHYGWRGTKCATLIITFWSDLISVQSQTNGLVRVRRSWNDSYWVKITREIFRTLLVSYYNRTSMIRTPP